MQLTILHSPFVLRLLYGLPYYDQDDIRFKEIELKSVYSAFDYRTLNKTEEVFHIFNN